MNLQVLFNKLLENACLRNKQVSNASNDALKALSKKNPNFVIQQIEIFLKNPTKITSTLLNLYNSLFCLIINESNEKNDNQYISIFKSLHSLYSKSKSDECFQCWDNLCKCFIVSENIAKNVFVKAIPISSVASLITIFYCSDFIPNEILKSLENSLDSTLINLNKFYYVRMISKLAEKYNDNNEDKVISVFLSFQNTFIFNLFLENPNNEYYLNCLELIIDNVCPNACPLYTKQFSKKICEINTTSMNETQILNIEKLLINFCFDNEVIKNVIEFILKNMYTEYLKIRENYIEINKQKPILNAFPIESIPLKNDFIENNNIFKLSIDYILQITQNSSEIVLSTLLATIDTNKSIIAFITLSSILNSSSIKFTEDQQLMIICSISAATSKRQIEPTLSQLCLDLLRLQFLKETDILSLTTYIITSSINISNSYFIIELHNINKEYHSTITEIIIDSLFDENNIALIPALLKTLSLIINKKCSSLTVNNDKISDSNGETSSNDENAHPLASVLVKHTINDKSLLLLRILSCLMSLGSLHYFVEPLIANLYIFFELTFPLAFEEIHTLLNSLSKSITSNNDKIEEISQESSDIYENNIRKNEFSAIITSLLSNMMKLINDRQFRISLCAAVINDIEMNLVITHIQNCISIFGTIIPFLPVDVASANIDKLFKTISFCPDDSNDFNQLQILNSFAQVLGKISGDNEALIMPLIKTWLNMKSNSGFMVRKFNSHNIAHSPQKSLYPIPYSFIALALKNVVRDIDFAVLVKSTNIDFLPLLLILMKKKEVNASLCLNVLVELCKRLTFHKVIPNFQFLIKEDVADFIFKYVLNIMVNTKQKQMYIPCLASFRYLLLVPPCLNSYQRSILRERIFTQTIITSILHDKQMFEEFRGLLLAILCALPDINTLMTLVGTLMPFIGNLDILNLVWRILTLFENSLIDSTHCSIKFYKKVSPGRIPILAKVIADLIGASYQIEEESSENHNINKSFLQTAIQCAFLVLQIDRFTNKEEQNNIENKKQNFEEEAKNSQQLELIRNIAIKSILSLLTSDELNIIISYATENLRKIHQFSPNYTFVLYSILKFTKLSIPNIQQILIEIISGTYKSSKYFIEELITKFTDNFVSKCLQTGFKDNFYSSNNIFISRFVKCRVDYLELFLKQICIKLLETSDDLNYNMNILLFISHIFDSYSNISTIYIYQAISSLLIFGFSTQIFTNVDALFIESYQCVKQFFSLKNEKICQQIQNIFIQSLNKCLLSLYKDKEKATSCHITTNITEAFNNSIETMIECEKTLLVDTMNFLMSSCKLNKWQISSGIALFSGEVIKHLVKEDLDENSSIMNIYFSTLLSSISLFDNFTNIVGLNSFSNLFIRNINNAIINQQFDYIPIQLLLRVLQTILKRCSYESGISKDTSLALLACIRYFCLRYLPIYSYDQTQKLTEKIQQILLDIIIAFCMNQDIVNYENNLLITVVFEILTSTNNKMSYFTKFQVIYLLLKDAFPMKPSDDSDTSSQLEISIDFNENKNDAYDIFNRFIISSVPWMVLSSLNLIRKENLSEISKMLIENVIKCLDSENDDVSSTATILLTEQLISLED